MKTMLAALAAGLLAASCAPSTPQARIDRSPEKFSSLKTSHQNLVRQGRIERGMPPDAVYLAWGTPSRIFQGDTAGKNTERWDYAGYRPVHPPGFHGPPGIHPYSPYGPPAPGFGPDVAYVPYRTASVWFVNNRVDAWERVR